VNLASLTDVRDAVILAAGNGDRFSSSRHHSKLLHPVLGQPLILRTLETAAAAGISRVTVVLGYEADRVRASIERHASQLTLKFVYNPDWHLENGVSALMARERCHVSRFALLMADHVFEPAVLGALLHGVAAPGDSLLAIDRTVKDPTILAEATRVQMEADRIRAIGKGLEPWHAVDTGVFVFTSAIFDEIEAAVAGGETTLSAGVRRLAARGLMRGVDIGRATWCDVDTDADLKAAETLFGQLPAVTERT
jgi:choline kinase